MTYDKLREFVIVWSFVCGLGTFLTFLIGPSLLTFFGGALREDQVGQLLKISLPVFFGYLSSAGTYMAAQISGKQRELEIDQAPSLAVLGIKGAFVTYIIAFLAVVGVYAFRSRPSAPIGSGMSIETLSTYLTVALVFLTGVTNSLVLVLFGRKK